MAYGGSVPPGPRFDVDFAEILPYQSALRSGVEVVLQQLIVDAGDRVLDSARIAAPSVTLRSMRALLNLEIESGNTYPFESTMDDATFLNYYCGYDVFVLRTVGAQTSESLSTSGASIQLEDPTFVGCFYVKPNFPGRSSHICNAGFLVAPAFRNGGAGHIMGERFRHVAKALGYRGSMFNLVFRTNVASNKLWEKLGFVNIGVIPGAGRLRLADPPEGGDNAAQEEYADALMWFFDLTVASIPHLRAAWEPPSAGTAATLASPS